MSNLFWLEKKGNRSAALHALNDGSLKRFGIK